MIHTYGIKIPKWINTYLSILHISRTSEIWCIYFRCALGEYVPLFILCFTYKTTKWGRPSDETAKTEVLCHNRCDTIKIPHCSKTRSTLLGPNLYSHSWRGIKQYIIKYNVTSVQLNISGTLSFENWKVEINYICTNC